MNSPEAALMKNSTLDQLAEANPKAICVRVEPYGFTDAVRQIMHDRRIGYVPDNVNQALGHLNEIVIEPINAVELRQICRKRRELRNTKRAMKSNASVLSAGVIVFGRVAQKYFDQLDSKTQTEAFLRVATDIANYLNTTLVGLVIHRDETSVHAHFCMPSFDLNGYPISDASSKSKISGLQDIAATAIASFESQVERGHTKVSRITNGAEHGDTDHLSLRDWKRLNKERRDELRRTEEEIAVLETRRLLESERIEKLEAKQAAAELAASHAEKRAQEADNEKERILTSAKLEGDALKAQACVEATQIIEKASQDAVSEVRQIDDAVALLAAGTVEPKPEGGGYHWARTVTDDERAKVGVLVRHRLLGPLLDMFRRATTELVQKIEHFQRLISRLETLEEEMTRAQREELWDVKASIDDEDYTL
ncbi:MAG: plasmid recombination protein [Devosia sp.]